MSSNLARLVALLLLTNFLQAQTTISFGTNNMDATYKDHQGRPNFIVDQGRSLVALN